MERPILTREWGFLVAGYAVRTAHSAEADPSRARLPGLWAQLEGGALELALPRRLAKGKPFVVYHDYDADQDRCTMLVGYQVRGLERCARWACCAQRSFGALSDVHRPSGPSPRRPAGPGWR